MVTYGAWPQRAASPIRLLLKPFGEALHVVHGDRSEFPTASELLAGSAELGL